MSSIDRTFIMYCYTSARMSEPQDDALLSLPEVLRTVKKDTTEGAQQFT